MLQCTGVKIKCGEYARAQCGKYGPDDKLGGYVKPGPQDCEIPRDEIAWCELPLSSICRAELMVHELAHACGWKHGQGFNVPGNEGKLLCF